MKTKDEEDIDVVELTVSGMRAMSAAITVKAPHSQLATLRLHYSHTILLSPPYSADQDSSAL